jgi:hypothetical protein
MTEYRVVWCQRPTAYHSKHVVFVEAETPKDAWKGTWALSGLRLSTRPSRSPPRRDGCCPEP